MRTPLLSLRWDYNVTLIWFRTWRGERGEEWSAAQGLESILLSIQSLMSTNPYENEPGFEDANEPSDKNNQKDYVQKVRGSGCSIPLGCLAY